MPCLLVLLALVAPRVVAVVLWLLTNWFVAAFHENVLLLVAGIVLMPFTTLAYAWAINAEGSVHSPFFLVVIVVAALMDISSWEGSRRSRYRRV